MPLVVLADDDVVDVDIIQRYIVIAKHPLKGPESTQQFSLREGVDSLA